MALPPLPPQWTPASSIPVTGGAGEPPFTLYEPGTTPLPEPTVEPEPTWIERVLGFAPMHPGVTGGFQRLGETIQNVPAIPSRIAGAGLGGWGALLGGEDVLEGAISGAESAKEIQKRIAEIVATPFAWLGQEVVAPAAGAAWAGITDQDVPEHLRPDVENMTPEQLGAALFNPWAVYTPEERDALTEWHRGCRKRHPSPGASSQSWHWTRWCGAV